MTERVTTDDNMTPSAAQPDRKASGRRDCGRANGCHSITVSQLQAMIKLIEQAAKST